MSLPLLALFLVSAHAAGAVDLPDGYRQEIYRAAVPDHVPGATAIATPEALALHKAGTALFIDVEGAAVSWNSDFNDWIIGKHRPSIPGAIWLPNVGIGSPDATIQAFFADQLAKHTKGDKDHPMVFFCNADCWLSWNAAKRAASLGYRKVYWFADGVDGWDGDDLPLVEIEPEPLVDR